MTTKPNPPISTEDILLVVARCEPDIILRGVQLSIAVDALAFRGSLRQLEAFYRVRVLGHTHDQAGETLGISPQSVGTLIRRFESHCGKPIPPFYRQSPVPARMQALSANLDQVLAEPYSSLAG